MFLYIRQTFLKKIIYKLLKINYIIYKNILFFKYLFFQAEKASSDIYLNVSPKFIKIDAFIK